MNVNIVTIAEILIGSTEVEVAGHVKKEKQVKPNKVEPVKEVPKEVIEFFEDKPTDAKAITIADDGKGGFNILLIELNSVTLETGKVSIIDTAGSRYEAVEKFKINVVKNKII